MLKAFLLKMNVPVAETEKLTGKVREKKMGELFADMEKMDIQAERRNTALEKERADAAEERAEEEKMRANAAEERANAAEEQAEEEKVRADEAEKRANLAEEDSIKLLVELCQKLGASRDAAVQSLMEKKNLSREEALKKTGLYWS